MGFGDKVEVIRPVGLRRRFAKQFEDLCERYRSYGSAFDRRCQREYAAITSDGKSKLHPVFARRQEQIAWSPRFFKTAVALTWRNGKGVGALSIWVSIQ